LDDLKMEKFKC